MIRSSSPKLNFFMRIPVPIATAAAGVASLIIHSLILVNPLLMVLINFGSLAAETMLQVSKEKANNRNRNFFNIINPF